MTLLTNITQESIELLRGSLEGGDAEAFVKAWQQPGSATTGINNYDLEAPAKSLVPVITPLRNRIPRMMADGGTQANWRAFTSFDSTKADPGVSDGNRGPVIQGLSATYFAAFVQIGLEDYVTWAAKLAAQGFMDLASRAQTNLLWSLMIKEERLDLGGLGTFGLGQGNRPTVADVGTGGTLAANTTYSVIVAPLSMQGLMTGTVAGGVRGSVTRTNADGSQDTFGGGTGNPSQNRAALTANDGNATHSLSVSTAVIPGAMGYAWFWGAAGNEVLGAITTTNSLVITAPAAGTQTAASFGGVDNSANNLVYDGVMSQLVKTGAGGYYYVMPTGTPGTGTPLTSDGVGGVVEIDAALQSFWDVSRLGPSTIWVNSQEARNITKKVLGSGTTGAQRFMINADQGNLKGGDLVTVYLNKFGQGGAKGIPIVIHPDIPAGTIFFDTATLPYPLNDVPDVLVKRLRQDYAATLWPPRTRKYEYGIYFDGVLQNYFPPAFGIITNIANG